MKIRVREDWKYIDVEVHDDGCPRCFCFWIEKKLNKYYCGRRNRQGCPDIILTDKKGKWLKNRGVWKEIK